MGNFKRITMNYNETGTHKKRRIAHPWEFRGTASAPFVPAQGLRAHENSLSLLTQASVNGGPRPNHRQVTEALCLCKCKVTGRQQHWGFYRYLLESALASNPTLAGGVSAALAPCLSRHGQPAATLLRKGDSSVMCILTTVLF